MTFYYFQLEDGRWGFWLISNQSLIARLESTKTYANEESVRSVINQLRRDIPDAGMERATV